MEKRNLNCLFILILICFSLFSVSALDPNKTQVDNKINVGIYILNLGKYDISTGSFIADFYLDLKCDNVCPEQDFEFMNGRAITLDKEIDEPNEKFYRIQAELNSPVNLKKFPFDNQKLEIILEDKTNTIEELQYVPNLEESGIDPSVTFIGWNIKNLTAESHKHYYPVYDETYSQYVLTVPISRLITSSIFKSFLPITFIILVMLSSFILGPHELTTRLAMVGSALVASVMFHVSLAGQIPPVGYLTFIDKFMVVTYFVVLMSFVFDVYLLELQEKKKIELVQKLHSYAKLTMFIIVPILYLILFLFFM
ncbi:MAG: hypothetical protein ACOYT4_03630 [Nanoarchaeota archaeon]